MGFLYGIQYRIHPVLVFAGDIPGRHLCYHPEDNDYREILYLEFSRECLAALPGKLQSNAVSWKHEKAPDHSLP